MTKDRERSGLRAPLAIVEIVQDVVHYAVVLILLIIAGIVLYHTAQGLFSRSISGVSVGFGERVINGINGVLFAVIIMELLHTVLAHFEKGGFQLQPFLIIGIISAVRHILSLGARLTLESRQTPVEFRHSQVELAINAGVVLALALSLLLVRQREPTGSD